MKFYPQPGGDAHEPRFCLVLMLALPAENWIRLGVWLVIGAVIYFSYGRRHSVLGREG